ncbi:XRE family transcriptional regulator [Chitinispirillales bacterium ANBcel5]|uniref:helix-turn-helix domain-containing protein n=1 Tax=Cellulosispirillum alkaliphilum TaxID=3039283 RepID=UPI002A502D2C|nr:XRE family transcriptional regulator [Chitinispirillales bacterium ANBcel5]
MDKTISELSEALGFNKTEQEKISKAIDNRSLSRYLTILRVKKGLTQGAMAKKMGVSQSNISKLEHSTNDRITITDVNNYVHTLGYELKLVIGKPKPLTTQIQYAYYHLVSLCKALGKTERNDQKILKGLAEFEKVAAHYMAKLAFMFLESSESKYNKLQQHSQPEICIEEESLDSEDTKLDTEHLICSDK